MIKKDEFRYYIEINISWSKMMFECYPGLQIGTGRYFKTSFIDIFIENWNLNKLILMIL